MQLSYFEHSPLCAVFPCTPTKGIQTRLPPHRPLPVTPPGGPGGPGEGPKKGDDSAGSLIHCPFGRPILIGVYFYTSDSTVLLGIYLHFETHWLRYRVQHKGFLFFQFQRGST